MAHQANRAQLNTIQSQSNPSSSKLRIESRLSTGLNTRLALLLIVVTALGLGACSPGSDDMLLDYQSRVARVLEIDVTQIADAQLGLSALPRIRSRDMGIELSDQRIDLLDFLRISNCAIGRVIGQRNSSLGKMAAPSQRFHLERDLLTLGPDCVQQIQATQPQLSETLNNILQVKQNERMASWWNAWFTSKEWQQFLLLYGKGAKTDFHRLVANCQ